MLFTKGKDGNYYDEEGAYQIQNSATGKRLRVYGWCDIHEGYVRYLGEFSDKIHAKQRAIDDRRKRQPGDETLKYVHTK